jgi:hypothetical protein
VAGWESHRAGQEACGQWGRSRPEDATRARLRALASAQKELGGRSPHWCGGSSRTIEHVGDAIGPESSLASELSSAQLSCGGGAAAQLDEMTERLERTISQAVRGAEQRLAREVSLSEARLAERLDQIEASVAAAAAAAADSSNVEPAALRLAQKQLHKITPRVIAPRSKTRSRLAAGLLSGRASVRSRGEPDSPRGAKTQPVLVSEAVSR